MNKGRRGPKARARWIQGANDNQVFAPPVWVRVQSVFAVYIKEVLGIPVPITVIDSELELGQWRYDRNNHSIVWHGKWDNSLDTGEWWLRQTQDGTEWTAIEFEMSIDGFDDTPFIRNTGIPNTQHGDWLDQSFDKLRAEHNVETMAPWISLPIAVFTWVSYGELREAGIDPDDTSPVTWDYTGEP